MKTWAVLLAALALLPLLAGCSSDLPVAPEPVTTVVPASRLENGTFYAFRHDGGDLAIAVQGDGSAEVVLYGADDHRIGHVGVGAEQARGRFVLDAVEAGELVVHARSINGTLDLRSNGVAVDAYRPLTFHVERHILAERAPPTTGISMPGNGATIDESIDLDLLRAPSEILGLSRALYDSLDITVTGRSGLVYEGRDFNNPFRAPGVFMQPLAGTFHPENVRDGKLTAHIQATNFEGVVVLETVSYSRAASVQAGAHETTDTPRFTYGVLPDQPVSFEVRSGSRALYLWQERTEDCATEDTGAQEPCAQPTDAHVALFGPQDEHVATLTVPANTTLAIDNPVAGHWVAVLLDGEATLGADRVPGDFELHPVDVVEAVLPSDSASPDGGRYGQGEQEVTIQGVPFHIEPADISGGATGDIPSSIPGDFLGIFARCEPTTLSVLLDGETIAAWGYDDMRSGGTGLPQALDGSLLLHDGQLTITFSDYGSNCDQVGVLVRGYQR